MRDSTTRRKFLKGTAGAGGTVPLVRWRQRQQTDYLSARVVDAGGNPVANAEVMVFNAQTSGGSSPNATVEKLAQATTIDTGSRIGEFSVTEFKRREFARLSEENDRIVLTVTWPSISTPGDLEWFGGVNLPAKNFFSDRFLDEDLRVTNEFLFAPTSRQRFGTVTAWRQIDVEDPQSQTVLSSSHGSSS